MKSCSVFARCSVTDMPLLRAELGDLSLQSGDTLHDCQLSYRCYGELSANRDNALLFPTWYMGTDSDIAEAGIIGPGDIFDTERFHVIVVNALGNGLSSSPSNSTRQPGLSFPSITLADMVASQRQLVQEVLEIEQLQLVTGVSMGGMQTYQWLASFPELARNYLAVQGTPWLTAYDRMLFGLRRQILNQLRDSDESVALTVRQLSTLDGLTLWTPDYISREVPASGVDGFVEEIGGWQVNPLTWAYSMLKARRRPLSVLT